MQQDYYTILGIKRDATDAEVKKAFRTLAMQYHPDRNHDKDETEQERYAEKFKEIQKAYAVLSDKEKRAMYDQYGEEGLRASMGGGAGAGFTGFDVFEDIFENIFSGGRRQRSSRPQRGADLQFNIQLNLEEAAAGKEIEINVPRHTHCDVCSGSGARKGSSPKNCETCSGIGQVRIQQGFFSIQQTCPSCYGAGKVVTDPCPECRGDGRVREEKKLSVKIPAGVDTGDRVRLSGEGEAGGPGATNGDLYVQVHVKQHPIFERHGNDLQCEVPISFVTAALGGTIEVPTLEGRVSLKIPPETQTGKLLRLRGKGVKSVRNYGNGDLLCKIIIETPVNLSREQKELLTNFQQSLESGKHSPRTSSWFDGVKKFFEDMKF